MVHTPGVRDADDGADDPSDLRAELAAERAAVEHWRRVAHQREAEHAALSGRLAVRVLLAVERHAGPLAADARSVGTRVRHGIERVALSAGALRRQGRRHDPSSLAGSARDPGLSTRLDLAVVVVGTEPTQAVSHLAEVSVEVVPDASAARAALARLCTTSAPNLVGVVAATTEPVAPRWLDHLASVIGRTAVHGRSDASDGPVAVAAVPLVVHPHRPLRHATPHDGLVRAAGVDLVLDSEGVPRAEARGAGSEPRPDGGTVDVDAGAAAAVVVDRGAYEAAGGLAAVDDLDAAVIELCARLRSLGGRVVMVPAAVVADRRPVRTRRELGLAVDPDGPGWRAAVARSGPVIRRVADRRERPPLRMALTVAAPSAKVAAQWGDWHLAQGLAAGLRRHGAEVLVQPADRADGLAGRSCDVHVVLRGLGAVTPSPGQRQVLWIISHPEAVLDAELDRADLVLVASPRFADHLRRRTGTPVEVLLQATDHRRFTPRPVDPRHRHDVVVVAKTRDVMRPAVADAVAAGLQPRIYGGGWDGLVAPELVVTDHVDNEDLPVVYSSAWVVLNDHWATMRTWGFVSNRLFDVLACGTPVISDPVEGVDELFDGAVLQYRSTEELRALVDEVLADPALARKRAARGRDAVLARHTFDHRAGELLGALNAGVEPS
jgi:glycosyltransferase involved in cell wall biosynthesis